MLYGSDDVRGYLPSALSIACRRHLLCSGFITEEGLLSNAKTTAHCWARNARTKADLSPSGRSFGIIGYEPYAIAASLVDQEIHSDQRTAFDPGLDVLISAKFLMNSSEDYAALGLIQNRGCSGGEVYSHTLLKMESELRMCQQVGVPVAWSWRSSRDIQIALDIVEPYLDAMGLPGFPPPGGDVDEIVMFKGILNLCVHMPSPVRRPVRMKGSVHR
jgi:hypothetical protein